MISDCSSTSDASLNWDVSAIADSRYEVKIQSQCDDALLPGIYEFNYYNTETIQFVLDKEPPAIYGTPQVGLYGPAEFVKQFEYTISFTETLYCEMPYEFTLRLTLSHNGVVQRTFSHGSHGSGLQVKCTGEVIKYRFVMHELDDYENGHSLDRTDVTILLEGVQDMARNQLDMDPITSVWDRSSSGGMTTSVETWDGIPSDVSIQQWQVAAVASGADMVRLC